MTQGRAPRLHECPRARVPRARQRHPRKKKCDDTAKCPSPFHTHARAPRPFRRELRDGSRARWQGPSLAHPEVRTYFGLLVPEQRNGRPAERDRLRGSDDHGRILEQSRAWMKKLLGDKVVLTTPGMTLLIWGFSTCSAVTGV